MTENAPFNFAALKVFFAEENFLYNSIHFSIHFSIKRPSF